MAPLPGPSDPLSGDRSPLDPPNDLKADFLQRYGTPVEPPKSVSPAAKKLLNKVFVWVLLIGIAVGGLVSVGIAIALQRAGLLGVPDASDAPAQVMPSDSP
ncbi:MAG: hypothetical protein AAF685_14175 [Cyanobacteria bacterium P01_C01_bin.89]